mmetsp:Transcript_6340/g.19165  ORF Transcript_6340/g.19165 Transcript_6340/m.19165 type:complete len:340 (-) Transcript_6340:556-1575(-)
MKCVRKCIKDLQLRLVLLRNLKLVSGLLLKEFQHVIDSATALVRNSLVLASCREEQNGWIALRGMSRRSVVLGGIHLGNSEGLNAGELLSELLVDRLELLAVTAPGSVLLNKHILVLVHHKLFPSVAHNDLDRLIVGLWNWCRLQVGLQLASNVLLDPGSNLVCCEAILRIVDVLNQTFELNDGNSGLLVNTDLLTELPEHLVVDPRKQNLAVAGELLGSLGHNFLVLVVLSVSGLSEEHHTWVRNVELSSLTRKLIEDRHCRELNLCLEVTINIERAPEGLVALAERFHDHLSDLGLALLEERLCDTCTCTSESSLASQISPCLLGSSLKLLVLVHSV